MNVKLDSITKDLKEAIKTPTEKTKPYDTTAEVLRVEEDTVWVHIAGGVEETPVKKTIDAKKGDTVQVRVSGGSAWLTGNATAPPTDDYTAKIANRNAKKAQLRADSASDIANKAQASADGKNTIYYDATQPIATEGGFKVGDTWFNSAEDNAIYRYNGTAWVKEEIGEDAIAELSIKTAHIQDGAITNAKVGNLDAGKITTGTLSTNVLNVSEIIATGGIATDSEVATAKSDAISTASADATAKANQAKSDAEKVATNYLSYNATNGVIIGYSGLSSKVQIKGSGLYLYDGSGNIGTSIEASKTRIGRTGVGYVDIQSTGIDMYAGSSNVNLAHIGYASGNAETGTAVAPYYTFGERASGAIGNYSFAEGTDNIASGFSSHAEGLLTTASNNDAHAEGFRTTASGEVSHAEGEDTTASGEASHAEGRGTTASAVASHASGLYTTANYQAQFVVGKYNTTGNYAFIVGNGTDGGSRSNALAVDWSGNITLPHGAFIYVNNASGTARNLCGFNSSSSGAPQYFFGYGSYSASEGNVYFDGNIVNIRSKGTVNITAPSGLTNTGTYNALYKITEVTVSVPAQSAYGYTSMANYTMTAQSGYNAVGIVGWTTGNFRIAPYAYQVNSNTVIRAGFANKTSTATTSAYNVVFKVLWLKATSG